MEVKKILKSGNSIYIPLPKRYANRMGLMEKMYVTVEYTEDPKPTVTVRNIEHANIPNLKQPKLKHQDRKGNKPCTSPSDRSTMPKASAT